MALFFNKTVFGGRPVSYIASLSQMDSLYHPDLKSVRVVAAIDPSIYFFRLPTSIAVEESWKAGVVPLWNSLNACGHPMLANIESGAFNWYVLLFPFSNEYLYNLSIVLRIGIAALGTYGLGRALGLRHLYATAAALALCFCPYILREVELSKETYAYPAMLALFVFAERKRGLFWSCVLSFMIGLTCATMHPECSLNLVFFACVLITMQRGLDNWQNGPVATLKAAVGTVVWLALVGIGAFCIASPVLIPFLEFVRNSDCYKFENGAPPRVPIQAFLLTLTNATSRGLSPFLGIFCLPALAVLAANLKRSQISLLLCTALAIALTTLVGPLLDLFALKPFNLLEPIYLQPLVMVFLAILMAMGLQTLFSGGGRNIIIFALASLLVLLIAWSVHYCKVSFAGWVWDGGEWQYGVSMANWRRDLLVVILALGALGLGQRFGRIKTALPFLVIALLFVSEWSVARQALPAHASFNVAPVPAVTWLKEHPARNLAIGRRLMFPNINMCWGISNLRHNNGLFPFRYLEFETLCGGVQEQLNSVLFEGKLTNFIDMASIKYLLADAPIYDQSDLAFLKALPSAHLADFPEGLCLRTADVFVDLSRRQGLSLLRWNCSN